MKSTRSRWSDSLTHTRILMQGCCKVSLPHPSNSPLQSGYALPTNGRGKEEGVKWKKRRPMMRQELLDKRLGERFARLREQLNKQPEASIPQACGSGHESKAAYRFL